MNDAPPDFREPERRSLNRHDAQRINPPVQRPALLEAKELLFTTPEPPLLGPGARAGTLSLAEINPRASALAARLKLPPENAELLRCAALLWHDHLDAAHVICQAHETGAGAWLHGILHRREPDYANAQYWFRRVGRPPVQEKFLALARELAGDPAWTPAAFVAACEAAERAGPADSRQPLLRRLQALELETLAAAFLA